MDFKQRNLPQRKAKLTNRLNIRFAVMIEIEQVDLIYYLNVLNCYFAFREYTGFRDYAVTEAIPESVTYQEPVMGF